MYALISITVDNDTIKREYNNGLRDYLIEKLHLDGSQVLRLCTYLFLKAENHDSDVLKSHMDTPIFTTEEDALLYSPYQGIVRKLSTEYLVNKYGLQSHMEKVFQYLSLEDRIVFIDSKYSLLLKLKVNDVFRADEEFEWVVTHYTRCKEIEELKIGFYGHITVFQSTSDLQLRGQEADEKIIHHITFESMIPTAFLHCMDVDFTVSEYIEHIEKYGILLVDNPLVAQAEQLLEFGKMGKNMLA